MLASYSIVYLLLYLSRITFTHIVNCEGEAPKLTLPVVTPTPVHLSHSCGHRPCFITLGTGLCESHTWPKFQTDDNNIACLSATAGLTQCCNKCTLCWLVETIRMHVDLHLTYVMHAACMHGACTEHARSMHAAWDCMKTSLLLQVAYASIHWHTAQVVAENTCSWCYGLSSQLG